MPVINQPLSNLIPDGVNTVWPLPNNSAMLLLGSDPTMTFQGWLDWQGYRTLYPSLRTNLALWSSNLLNGVWVTVNVSDSATTGPDGGSSAIQATATANNAYGSQNVTVVAGTYTHSVWIQRVSGVGNIYLWYPNGTQGPALPVTTSWQRFSITGPSNGTNALLKLGWDASGDVFNISDPQLEAGSTPTGFISTSAAAASATDVTIHNANQTPSNNYVSFSPAPVARSAPPLWSGQTFDRGN
jgi:hypothetical protein